MMMMMISEKLSPSIALTGRVKWKKEWWGQERCEKEELQPEAAKKKEELSDWLTSGNCFLRSTQNNVKIMKDKDN